MKPMKMCSFVSVILLLGWQSFASGADEPRYALIELSVLSSDEPYSWTRALDDAGNVVGASSTDAIGFAAVGWTPGGMIVFAPLAGEQAEAKGLNQQGEVVGWSTVIPGNTATERAVLWRSGIPIDLGTLGGEESEANAINEAGQVVGSAESAEGGGPFLWENGEMVALSTLGLDGGGAYDINNVGRIVGTSWSPESGEEAALWVDGEITALPSLGYHSNAAIAINELDQIVGQCDTLSQAHAVAWDDGVLYDLHNWELGPASSAWGINNLGQVVGWTGEQLFNVSGFLWEQESGLRTLDSLVPPNLRRNWRIDMAWDINDAGQIAAQGYVVGNPLRLYPFLLSPVRPTMTVSQPTPGLAGEVNSLSITGVTPGARVHFLYSRNGGGTRIPGCDLQENALMLDSPKLAGSIVADANGEGVFTFFVPDAARNLGDILIQAVVPGECAVSNLVVEGFE